MSNILTLTSPDRKHTRQFEVKERVKGFSWQDDPQQKEISELLSRGWRIARKEKKSQCKTSGMTPKQLQHKLVQEFIKRQIDSAKGKKGKMPAIQAKPGNDGRQGQRVLNPADELDREDIEDIAKAIATLQHRGKSQLQRLISFDIEVIEFMRASKAGEDFTPYLHRPDKVPVQRILVTIDTSPSTSRHSGMAKNLAEALSKHPDVKIEYCENFNGHPYDEDIIKSILNKEYGLIIYVGDTDVNGSMLDDSEMKVICLMHYPYLQNENRGVVEKGKVFKYHTDFSALQNIYLGILYAREYYQDIGVQ